MKKLKKTKTNKKPDYLTIVVDDTIPSKANKEK